MWTLAQDVGSGLDGLPQYGAIGILALAAILAVRVLFKMQVEAFNRERARSEKLEDELRKLNEDVRDKYVANLVNATQVMANFLERQGGSK